MSVSDVPAGNRRLDDNTISIHNASPADSAVYQCEASNRHGTILANANMMFMSEYGGLLRGNPLHAFRITCR